MAKIKFVREYDSYGHKWFDVIYTSSRTFTFIEDCLPKTAKAFIAAATSEKQYDKVFKREEIIYQ